MAATAFVRARIDEGLKEEAASVLALMGLTVSDVVRMTLTRIAIDKALPFEVRIPNAETQAAINESRALIKAGRPQFNSAEEAMNALDKDAR